MTHPKHFVDLWHRLAGEFLYRSIIDVAKREHWGRKGIRAGNRAREAMARWAALEGEEVGR